jgi:peptide/nickel transport system permease protein
MLSTGPADHSVILLAVTLVFLAGHAVPDYAVRSIAQGLTGAENLDQAKQQVRHDLGLDKPLLQQYVEYVGGLAKGDLGTSFITKQPVLEELKLRMPVSVELGLLSLLVAMVVSIPVGIISAVRQDTWLDYVLRFMSILGLAIPAFYLGVLLLIFVFKVFDWAPPLTPTAYRDLWEDPVQNLKQMALPAIAGGLALGAGMMRLLRSQLLEVLRQDFVRTAWAKGLRERTIIFRHVLKTPDPCVHLRRSGGRDPVQRRDSAGVDVLYSRYGRLYRHVHQTERLPHRSGLRARNCHRAGGDKPAGGPDLRLA